MLRKMLGIGLTILMMFVCTVPIFASDAEVAQEESVLQTDPTFLEEAFVEETENGAILTRTKALPTRNSGQMYRQDTVELIADSDEQKAQLLSILTNESGSKTASGMDGAYTVELYTTIYYTLHYNNNEGLAAEVTFERIEGGFDVRSWQVQVTDHWINIDYLGDNSVGAWTREVTMTENDWVYTIPSSVATTQNNDICHFNLAYTVTVTRGTGSWNYTLRNYLQLAI